MSKIYCAYKLGKSSFMYGVMAYLYKGSRIDFSLS